MKFPKIEHILRDETIGKLTLSYAAVLNGRIQATNRHAGIYLKASNYIKPEQLAKAEGKVFNSGLLLKMADADEIEFTETEVVLKIGDQRSVDGLKTVREFYSGKINPETHEILKYDDLFDDFEEPSGDYFEGVHPYLKIFLTDTEPDVAKIQKRSTHFRGVMFDPSYLVDVMTVLPFKDPAKKYINMEFLHADASKKNVERPSAPIIISPIIGEKPLYEDLVFLMPYLPTGKYYV